MVEPVVILRDATPKLTDRSDQHPIGKAIVFDPTQEAVDGSIDLRQIVGLGMGVIGMGVVVASRDIDDSCTDVGCQQTGRDIQFPTPRRSSNYTKASARRRTGRPKTGAERLLRSVCPTRRQAKPADLQPKGQVLAATSSFTNLDSATPTWSGLSTAPVVAFPRWCRGQEPRPTTDGASQRGSGLYWSMARSPNAHRTHHRQRQAATCGARPSATADPDQPRQTLASKHRSRHPRHRDRSNEPGARAGAAAEPTMRRT